jgi:hypothetical protein
MLESFKQVIVALSPGSELDPTLLLGNVLHEDPQALFRKCGPHALWPFHHQRTLFKHPINIQFLGLWGGSESIGIEMEK